MRKQIIFKHLAVLLAGIITSSCDSAPNGALTLKHVDEAVAVTGATSNCTDKRGGTTPFPQSVTADFFQMATFNLDWKGTNELVPAEMTITLNHPYLDGGEYECSISGTLLEDTFGVPPYAGPALIQMNDGIRTSCAIACGGIKKKAAYEDTSFSTIGTIEFTGYSQDPGGTNVAPVRAISRVRVEFY